MPLNSERFNTMISFRRTLLELQKMKIVEDCPTCSKKVQDNLNEIQAQLEDGAEYGVVTP